jgi:hypothetical protein
LYFSRVKAKRQDRYGSWHSRGYLTRTAQRYGFTSERLSHPTLESTNQRIEPFGLNSSTDTFVYIIASAQRTVSPHTFSQKECLAHGYANAELLYVYTICRYGCTCESRSGTPTRLCLTQCGTCWRA